MQPKPLRLLFDAMHHGKYQFEDFLHADVASSYTPIHMKKRTAYRPDRKLKAYQIFLNTFLFDHLKVNKRIVYSYRKGVNPHEVAFPHARSRAFFQIDIENFFGSIDRHLIESTILSQEGRVPISDLRSYIERILELTVVNDALPIGFPTSPPISNACLTRFDNELEEHCLIHDLVCTRYSDDIVVSAKSRDALFGIESKLNELLTQHFSGNLKLNRAKKKFTSIGRKTRILGMVILPNGQVTIDMELKKRIEVLLHFYIHNRPKFIDMSDGDIGAGIKKLSGYVNYINSADRLYLEKLKRKFGATVVDSFLHRSAH